MRSPGKTGAWTFATLLLAGAATTAAAPALGAPRDPNAILAELEKDTAHQSLVAGALGHARDALTRARSMDLAGDGRHATILRQVAIEWLDLGRDLIRTATTEAATDASEKDLDDLDTKLVRGRALLEETVARRGRARQLFDQLEPGTPVAPADPSKSKHAGLEAPASKPHAASKGAAPSPGAASATPAPLAAPSATPSVPTPTGATPMVPPKTPTPAPASGSTGSKGTP
ncbi:MAG TPA: hypothetical protein VH142_11325 [Polyangiaceae bacterium]|nr:hypothetical protein [Polyangiaceae bacterium]